MIRLSEQSPLGTRRHQKCYAHPEDAQHCIKIVYHHGNGGNKEIHHELKYYTHLGHQLKDWSGIPRYHSTIETDCRTSYVYNVIADFDSKPSITLTKFAEQCHYKEDIAQLRQLLKQLKHYLQDNHIMTMSLKPQNILCHHISESEVIPVICNNIGESTLIPLATWSKWCCLHKQEQLWKQFITQPALAIALQKDLQPHESKTLALTSRKA